MSPVTATHQVFDAIQQAKTGASAFCTNFFPAPAKLEGWIGHQDLFGEFFSGTAFFYRKDHGFWHWYFCAADPAALSLQTRNSAVLGNEAVVVDLVGKEQMLSDLLERVEAAGFKRYRRLVRLARPAELAPVAPRAGQTVRWAEASDAPAIMGLLEKAFDRFADQFPTTYELETAIQAKQILVIETESAIAAFLFFETQGVTSTVRYWAVDQQHRDNHLGSALIRHYFASQSAVRRFVLWVAANNESAVAKYNHYGYATDGLIDHVLVNDRIHA